MKNVMSPQEVAHAFANQLQASARTSTSNLYFENNVIYSYGRHFAIAKHVVNAKGEHALTFTERGYSNTTAKHISVVRSASNHKNIIYCHDPLANHEHNLKQWQVAIEQIARNLERAKKPEKYLSQIDSVKHTAMRYVNYFELQVPVGLQAAFEITNKDQFAVYSNNKAAFEKAAATKRAKELKKTHAVALKKWLSGETHVLYARDGYDYLRVNDGRIETSQGVKMLVPHALELHSKIKQGELNVGDKILEFNVTKVGAEITVGCHNFKKSYLLKFGEQLIAAQ